MYLIGNPNLFACKDMSDSFFFCRFNPAPVCDIELYGSTLYLHIELLDCFCYGICSHKFDTADDAIQNNTFVDFFCNSDF